MVPPKAAQVLKNVHAARNGDGSWCSGSSVRTRMLGANPRRSMIIEDKSPPVVFFMPGIFASHFHELLMDVVGKKMGVRLLTADRRVCSTCVNP